MAYVIDSLQNHEGFNEGTIYKHSFFNDKLIFQRQTAQDMESGEDSSEHQTP
jgi:hypothetical protein